MAAIANLTEEEKYLVAILDDPSGIELAELLWIDEEQPTGCFRVWPYQWRWYRNESTYQIDHASRSMGKSVGIQMRAFAFPFHFPGQEMLITAPELNHLRPITDKVEHMLLTTRLGREMLPDRRGNGINRQPQFQAHFKNNSRIVSRLPNRDGRGVKTCCAGDVLVLTTTGHKRMDEVAVGDFVLTHMGRWQPVLARVEYPDTDVLEVAGGGHRGLIVSKRHSFLTRRNRSVCRKRSLAAPLWTRADEEELGERHYWASPLTFPELELPDPPAGINDGVTLLELAGRWVADGCAYGNQVSFVDDEAGIRCIEALAKQLGLRTVRRAHQNAVCTVIGNRQLADWVVAHFGKLAAGKSVPPWLLGAPSAARGAFLRGYLDGDGHYNADRNRWEFGSASKSLAMGVKLLAQSLGWHTTYTWVDPKVKAICGIPLKSEPQRSHRVQLIENGQSIHEDGNQWSRIRSATPAGKQVVYDLIVANDHSYVADGLIHLGSAWLPDGTEA